VKRGMLKGVPMNGEKVDVATSLCGLSDRHDRMNAPFVVRDPQIVVLVATSGLLGLTIVATALNVIVVSVAGKIVSVSNVIEAHGCAMMSPLLASRPMKVRIVIVKTQADVVAAAGDVGAVEIVSKLTKVCTKSSKRNATNSMMRSRSTVLLIGTFRMTTKRNRLVAVAAVEVVVEVGAEMMNVRKNLPRTLAMMWWRRLMTMRMSNQSMNPATNLMKKKKRGHAVEVVVGGAVEDAPRTRIESIVTTLMMRKIQTSS